MKKQLVSLVLLYLTMAPVVHAEQFQYCHDGDTCKTTGGQSVRYACIDAPELKQPMGYAARDHLKGLVGQDTSLECVGKSYKRKVCFVSSGDQDVNLEMIQDGFAFADLKYPYCHEVAEQFLQAQEYAESNRLGVWDLPGGGERPWEFRREQQGKKQH